jgi:beta-lactamase regulating signal transducer with metallopeptidase domain
MRKESFFVMNRILLLTIVVSSAIIPLLYLPKTYQPPVQVELLPVFVPVKTSPVAKPTIEAKVVGNVPVPEASISEKRSSHMIFTVQQLIQCVYFVGFLITLLFLVYSLITILLLFRKVRSIKMDGYRLLIIDREIAAFSFGRFVVLSQNDYEEHRQTLLAHEQAHIRLYHFFDLLLLEIVRIFHWFNPFIHRLIRDMKEIHEFQADDYTITKGIDEIQYKLLIIQKGVGSQMFALANSFNHCQIKKRLVMMNKQKPSKAWSWKVATFLPLLALLLMAFGRKAETGPPGGSALSSIAQVVSKDSTKQWSEGDFLSLDGLNRLIKMGKIPNWTEPEFGSVEINGKWITTRKPYFSGFNFYKVQIDSKSQIWVGHPKTQSTWNELKDSIQANFDFAFANERTNPYFHACMVNGVKSMSPICIVDIFSDLSTPLQDYQRFLNTIGNTILEIREKHSLEIFKIEYSKLSSEQREQIDIMIPLIARFIKSPQLRPEPKIVQENKNDSSELFIEIRRDGNYISNKLYSREDFINQINGWKKINGRSKSFFKFTLPGFELSDYRNIELTAISKATQIPFVQNMTVDQQATFPGGMDAMFEWIKKNIRYSNEDTIHPSKKDVVVNFVVDANGKIVNTLILKGINPEIDAEVLKVVSQMPAWKPALKNGFPFNADYTIAIPLKLCTSASALSDLSRF